MSRAAFQKGSHLWGSEFSPGAPRSALSFGMNFTRAIFSSGVTGAFFENARATKEPGAPNGAMNGDDFLFDDLSMFSNEDIAAPISSLKLNFPICQTSDSSIAMSETVSSGALHEKSSSQATNMLIEPSLHNCKDALAPSREMTELEGFSTFGEDALIFGGSNFRGDSFLIQGVREFSYGSRIVDDAREEQGPIDSSKDNIVSTHEQHAESGNEVFALESPVPGRSRSKRSRSGARIWSSGVLYENNPGLSNLTTPSQPLCLSDFQYLSQSEADHDELSDVDPLVPVQRGETSSNTKKAGSKASKKKKNQENGQARRCAHCLSQKTPQWRAGPTGPKTLCNACGVRFKSGRLFPEYMPAKSPTFSTHRHSNSHRKVLEMRHQKEVEVFKKQTLDYNGRHRLSVVDQSYGAGSYNDQRSIDQSYGVPRDDRKTDVHTHYTNHELTV